MSRFVEGTHSEGSAGTGDSSVTWSDRRKRDRLKEKELLAKAKYVWLVSHLLLCGFKIYSDVPGLLFYRRVKLTDDDDDEMDMAPAMKPTCPWHPPALLPERSEVMSATLQSKEVDNVNERVKTIAAAYYSSPYDVPDSPAPLSDVEQAVDMTSQSSAVVATIPFFIPPPAPAPEPTPTTAYDVAPAAAYGATQAGATPEFVQSLGLPMFLVGQNTAALQLLTQSPGLLASAVDPTGQYDQARLIQLVQTLVSQGGPTPTPAAFSGTDASFTAGAPTTSTYGPGATNQSSTFRSGSSEGNLHISGYGMATTQADIIALFSPYVHVDEVVMKGTFSFVNTSDPTAAQRAREALNGTLLGGLPLRINAAQRKNRDGMPSATSQYQPTAAPPQVGPSPYEYGGAPTAPTAAAAATAGAVDPNSVRDDRGNPATKNLFVAGYGPGTTEQQIRDLFGQHATVIGVVSKGSFSFVNTADRNQAINVRQILGGTMLNNGVLRINFAKETGRLGTSFDLTYGPNTGPRTSGPPPNASYYGRGY